MYIIFELKYNIIKLILCMNDNILNIFIKNLKPFRNMDPDIQT